MFESDIDTRRRSACDLVKALSKQFEGPVIQNFSQYVQAMLQVRTIGDVCLWKRQLWYIHLLCLFLKEYSQNPVTNWKSKDAAIFLVTTLASKGQTQKVGGKSFSTLYSSIRNCCAS